MGLFIDTCRCGHSILNHETGGRCREILVFAENGLRVCQCPVYRDNQRTAPDDLAVYRAAFAGDDA